MTSVSFPNGLCRCWCCFSCSNWNLVNGDLSVSFHSNGILLQDGPGRPRFSSFSQLKGRAHRNLTLNQNSGNRMALSPEVRVVIQCLLAAIGYRTAKWFNSPGPQRAYYQYYVLIFVLAQLLGMRSGMAVVEDKKAN